MSLIDANLNEAYSDLAWLRRLMDTYPAGVPGSDPVMSLFQPLDWNKGSAEDYTDHVVKAARETGASSEELYEISRMASWTGNAADTFQGVVTALEGDYDHLNGKLTDMHKAVGDVFDGLDGVTKSIVTLAGDIKTKYGYLIHEAETLAGQGTPANQVSSEMSSGVSEAYEALSGGVEDAQRKIAELAKDLSGFTAPLHLASQPG